jgi:hypothetical protein
MLWNMRAVNARLTIFLTLALIAAGAIGALMVTSRFHQNRSDYDYLIPSDELTSQSPSRTREFLARIQKEISSLSENGSESNNPKLMMISSELRTIATVHPELPELWQTAGATINRRSETYAGGELGKCGEEPKTFSRQFSPDSFENVSLVSYRNCIISLDDDLQVYLKNRGALKKRGTRAMLELHGAHVLYKGRAMLPLDTISFVNCTFDFELDSSPSPLGRSLVRGILSEMSDNFAIEISSDEEQSPVNQVRGNGQKDEN